MLGAPSHTSLYEMGKCPYMAADQYRRAHEKRHPASTREPALALSLLMAHEPWDTHDELSVMLIINTVCLFNIQQTLFYVGPSLLIADRISIRTIGLIS